MCVWCVVCGVFVVCVVRLGCVWWMLSCLDARPACDVAMLRSVVCCRRPLAWSMRTTRSMRHAMCDVCELSMSMVKAAVGHACAAEHGSWELAVSRDRCVRAE